MLCKPTSFLFHFFFFIVLIWADNLFAAAADLFLDQVVVTFWTGATDWFVPRSKFAGWVAVTSIEDAVSFALALDDLAFLTKGAGNADGLDDLLGIAAVWEIRTGVEFAIFAQLDDHGLATDITVKTCWLILDLDFFHLAFGLGQFKLKGLVKAIDDLLPLLLANFDIIQFLLHFGSKGDVDDIGEKFHNQLVDNFAQFSRFEALGNQFDIIAFLNGFDGWCVGGWTANPIFFQGFNQAGF